MVVADRRGRIFPVPGIEPLGMESGRFFRFRGEDLIPLPEGSRLFMLPGRTPVGYDGGSGNIRALDRYLAAAAFTPPGFTVTHNSAYEERGTARILPLFAYAAVAWRNDRFYAAVTLVDRDRRHSEDTIDIKKVREKIKLFRKIFPHNRVVRHLERCATGYSCPNAQNFFLSRYEAPLPVSPRCNANCAGCISYQPRGRCPATQPRIRFTPAPEELSEVALFHIDNVLGAIVSFGQGCEGEPLLAADTISETIRLIRRRTPRGTIHMNTNASRPEAVRRLFDSGLDSMRVSMNSVRPEYYTRYYKPRGYTFRDVLRSIESAPGKRGFVALNYLTMPGFTDSESEFAALKGILKSHNIGMIQWRNLNFDPQAYFREIGLTVPRHDILGIRHVIASLKKDFPGLLMGYFNPPKKGQKKS